MHIDSRTTSPTVCSLMSVELCLSEVTHQKILLHKKLSETYWNAKHQLFCHYAYQIQLDSCTVDSLEGKEIVQNVCKFDRYNSSHWRVKTYQIFKTVISLRIKRGDKPSSVRPGHKCGFVRIRCFQVCFSRQHFQRQVPMYQCCPNPYLNSTMYCLIMLKTGNFKNLNDTRLKFQRQLSICT